MTQRFIIGYESVEKWKPDRVFTEDEKRHGIDHLFTAKEIAEIEATLDRIERKYPVRKCSSNC